MDNDSDPDVPAPPDFFNVKNGFRRHVEPGKEAVETIKHWAKKEVMENMNFWQEVVKWLSNNDAEMYTQNLWLY